MPHLLHSPTLFFFRVPQSQHFISAGQFNEKYGESSRRDISRRTRAVPQGLLPRSQHLLNALFHHCGITAIPRSCLIPYL